MKYFIFFIPCLILFSFGCKEDAVVKPVVINEIHKTLKEYNVSNENLKFESITQGIDTTLVFINGRLNNKLWVGCFKRKSKLKMFEWIDNNNLDTTFKLNVGFGNLSTVPIDRFVIKNPILKDDMFYFILWGYNSNYNGLGRVINSDLYFVKNNRLIKKSRAFTLPLEKFYNDIKPWDNGIFTKYIGDINIFFNNNGDSLYTYEDKFSSISNSVPINQDEGVVFKPLYLPNNFRENFFTRVNFRLDKVIWTNSRFPLKDVPANVRLDSTIINKQNDIWEYNFYLTAIDGKLVKVKSILDIKTGDLK